MLNFLRNLVYRDAVRHGLWADDHTITDGVLLIGAEVKELLIEANKDKVTPELCEELADVIIMCLSFAGRFRINIAKHVLKKIRINRKRSWRHE